MRLATITNWAYGATVVLTIASSTTMLLASNAQQREREAVEQRYRLDQATATLGDSQKAAATLGTAITAQVERLTTLWADYQQRFGVVDEQLGRAFARLAEETTKQSQILADRTAQIDKALAEAIDRLGPAIGEVGEGAGELAESVEALQKLMAQRPTLR